VTQRVFVLELLQCRKPWVLRRWTEDEHRRQTALAGVPGAVQDEFIVAAERLEDVSR
jgi:hypothetical protein